MIGYILGLSIWFIPLLGLGFLLQPVQNSIRKKAQARTESKATSPSVFMGSGGTGSDLKNSFTVETRPSGAFRQSSGRG